jgi:AcrR family transcriptional regulator
LFEIVVDSDPARKAELEPPATRERLLDAAEELFALHGFAGTSVRDLTQRAECNLAAINYHFGNKEKLYQEVLRRLLGWLREYRLQGLREVSEQPGACMEDVLNTFARVFVEPLVEGSRGPRVIELFLWEMLQPRLPPGMVQTELIRPIVEAFTLALEKHCPELTEESLKLCTLSLVGQLAYLLQVGRIVKETGPGDHEDVSLPDRQVVLEHIVRFTAAGIRNRAVVDTPKRES